MPANATGTALSRRLAALTPEQRALLGRRLVRATSDPGASDSIPLQPRGAGQDFPLSSAQERIWFNHQWDPAQPLYHEGFAVEITGALDLDTLARSFDLVMARHEIFTVTFHAAGDRLVQRPASCALPRLEFRDLSIAGALGDSMYETESRMLLREPFVLDRGPLFRARVWRMPAGAHRLILAMHHIIFDGWSGALFFRELLTTYSALREGHSPELPPVSVQYVDFAVWERTRLKETAAELDRQLQYWNRQLAGSHGPTTIAPTRQVAAPAHQLAVHESFVCPAGSIERLKSLARDSGATLFMALLAAFKLLVARYASQDDVLIALPVANRNHAALNDVIGVFINTVVLRTDLSGRLTFREALRRVRQTALDAQANQDVGFERVVGELDYGRDGRSPISIVFDLQKRPASLVEVPGLSIRPLDVGSGAAKFDLVFGMEDSGAEIRGALECVAGKFDSRWAKVFVRRFLRLMEAAAAEPDELVDRLSILEPGEARASLSQGLETPPPARAPYLDVLANAVDRPDSLALAAGKVRWSARELHERANRLAATLTGMGVGPGQRVTLLLRGGPYLAMAQLAVSMTGAAFVPLDPTQPAARLDSLIRDAEASVAIVDASSRALLALAMQVIDLDRDTGTPGNAPFQALESSDPAYLIYTSGSTGQPKAVVVSHAALANLSAWHRRAFDLSPADRATQIASPGFDASIWEIWPYLAAGASIHFPPPELIANAAGMRDWLVRERITVCFTPTLLAEELLELKWPSKTCLRFLLTGGDRLRKSPPRGLPFQFVNNYGPTENAVVTTSGIVPPDGGVPSIGTPIDNVWIRIVDANLEAAWPGAPGELLVGGRSLAAGYWNRPDLTAEKFVTLPDGERAYRTGDLCRLREGGEIEYIGRIDSQVKVRGCRIELGEIEATLLAHPGVRDAAAAVHEDANGHKRIVAYVVAANSAHILQSLRGYAAERLPGYMLPASFVEVRAIPRSASGKIDRATLPAPEPEPGPGRQVVQPRTATERDLVVMWKQLLNIEDIGVRDDFFEAGGESLLATRLALMIRERFQVDLPLASLFRAPTIEALAAFIEAGRGQAATLTDHIVPLKSGNGALPALFLTPPAAGSPACYAAFVSALRSDFAIYGFQAPGLVGGRPIQNLNEQAQAYIQSLRALQPRGPYHLAGWSLGGPVAFEMACQLREAGDEVAFLGLIDSGLPVNGRLPGGLPIVVPMWWSISFPFTERVPLNYATVRLLGRSVGIALPESLGEIGRRGMRGTARFLGELVRGGWRSLGVFIASLKGLKRYAPRRFDGVVTLFQTAPRNTSRDNGALVENLRQWSARVEAHHAPGMHMTVLLDPRIAAEFAAIFEQVYAGSLPSALKE